MAIREIAKVGVCLEPHRESLRGRTVPCAFRGSAERAPCATATRASRLRSTADRPSGREGGWWYPARVSPRSSGARAALASLLLDGQKAVRPGGEVEGILVFRLPPPGTKSFRLEIALTLPDGSSAGLGAVCKLVRK